MPSLLFIIFYPDPRCQKYEVNEPNKTVLKILKWFYYAVANANTKNIAYARVLKTQKTIKKHYASTSTKLE